MHDPAAFLAAIVESPDDDLPRLVFADWLDETCQPGAAERAEFIRTQCELDRLPPDDDRRNALRRRERLLLRKHADTWLAELTAAQVMVDRDPHDKGRPVWQFRRGFLHTVAINAQRFPTVAEQLFRHAPTVRAVRLCQGSGSVEGLLRTPQLARVAELELSQMCTCGRCPILSELRNLFASPLLSGLTRLTLAHDRIDPETTAALVSSPNLSGLHSLDLSHNELGLGGVRVLAASRNFVGLRELSLSNNGITASGGRAIARAPWLKGLRVLDLSWNNLTDTSGRALLNAEFGDDLVRIDLLKNDLGRDVRRLLQAKYGAKVRLTS